MPDLNWRRYVLYQVSVLLTIDPQIVANGDMKEKDAYALASTNLEELLGIRLRSKDLVVYKGGHAFELSSKPVAIISPERGFVDVL